MVKNKQEQSVNSNSEPIHLKDEAFRDLERLIVNGRLEPGRWVSETDLIKISGHTRAPVRSAIQRLEDEGLLHIVPRRGAQVCPIDHKEQFRALELRRVVEVLVGRSAAKRATTSQKKHFAKIANSFKETSLSGSQVAMTELDAEWFSHLINVSDNKFAARALTSVKGLSRRFWVLHEEKYGDIKRMAAAHANIALAVSAGDEDAASKAVNELIDYVEEFTLEVVGFSATKLNVG